MKSLQILLFQISFLLIPIAHAWSCSSGQWKCKNGDCITDRYLCDGGRHCNDHSDEEHCSCTSGPSCYKPPPPPCPIDSFRCMSGECIPKIWECDGDFDCVDLSDEHQSCERTSCTGLQFTCDNGFCIDGRLKCNGMNDCGDSSDEVICRIMSGNSSKSAAIGCGNNFQCKDGQCIDFKFVCDGSPNCLDGSDEGGLCQSACSTGPSICDHNYQKTPSGCLCTCNKGYKLAGDGITCVDIFECAKDPPVCSQLCTENEGSYSCGCFKGFKLRNDNITCKSQGDPMSIYFVVGNEIRQFNPSRRTLKVIHIEETGNITGLELNIQDEVLYYSVLNSDSLHYFNTKNATKKVISHVKGARTFAYDWITENIYFVSEQWSNESSEKETEVVMNQIQVCNFQGRHCVKIATFEGNISALAVDPINKFLFYVLTTEDDCKIYRSMLDGRFAHVLSACISISDITVDYRFRFVYIANETTINRIKYDEDLEQNYQQVNILNTEMHIKGLNIFQDYLYFLSDWGRTMLKCALFGDTRKCISFRLSANSTSHFVIAQSSRQTPGRNPCVTYACNQLCIPHDNGASCLCKNGNIVEEDNDCRD